MTQVAVLGARGYAGRELVSILNDHPRVQHVAPVSTSVAGDALGDHVPRMVGSPLRFHGPETARNAAVVFLATPDEAAHRWMAEGHQNPLVVDLSRQHREQGIQRKEGWRYGMSDLRPVSPGTRRVANPGCYPTATALSIGPLVAAGVVGKGTIIVDGKSGISGAGVSPRADLHYPEATASVRAYKIDGHDHQKEMQDTVASLGGDNRVRFTPHLVPQARGLLTTSYLPLGDASPDDVQTALEDAYADNPSVHVVSEPATGHVRNTNQAHVAAHTDEEAGLIIARGAIDNLLKGAAGTAVQNMNDALGWDRTEGLGGI